MKGNNSEVARLTAQIAAEYAGASQGLEGYAATTRHEMIRARMERAHRAGKRLIDTIGAEQALPLIQQAMEGKTD